MTKCCKTCRWFEPFRNLDTGHICPSRPAVCTWDEFEWPEDWPVAYTQAYEGVVKPTANKTWASNGKDCPCWAAKVQKRARGRLGRSKKPVRSRAPQPQLPGVAKETAG